MRRKIAWIGCGNMGGAMLRRMLADGIYAPEEVIVSDKNSALLDALHKELGVCVTEDNTEAAQAEKIVLAVKPQFIENVIAEIASFTEKDALIISIVMSYEIGRLALLFGNKNAHIVRVMPNTPALVGEGVMAACRSESVTDEEWQFALRFLSSMGLAEEVPEKLMEAVTGVSGCGPAYCFLFIEALADAGVRAGLPRQTALRIAAQTLLGSGKMALESGKHPGELKDMVTSPGGATIEGVAALERGAFRSCAIEAVHAAIEKAKSFK